MPPPVFTALIHRRVFLLTLLQQFRSGVSSPTFSRLFTFLCFTKPLSSRHLSPSLPPLCRMLSNIFCSFPLLSFTSHSGRSSGRSLLSVSLWPAHRMLSSISCHQGYRKEAKRGAVWCAISSNSLHLDCTGVFFPNRSTSHSLVTSSHSLLQKRSRLHFFFVCL